MQPDLKSSELLLEEITKKILHTQYPDYKNLNSIIIDKFNQYKDHPSTNKTHLFEGRYENIYISTDLILEIQTVLTFATRCVEKITGKSQLHSGLWFNYMEPGEVTLPHSHDDDDEIYSAVYYLKVPEDSGHLIINEKQKELIIKPQAGMLVLFPPELVHHVTKNNSNEFRLSLGINIGCKT